MQRVAKLSAGVLLYRFAGTDVEVLIAHPGGPFWARKDAGAWSVPKGEYTEDEDPWLAAQREFAEELGAPPPAGPRTELVPVKQAGGKVVTAFAVRGDFDPAAATSNTFSVELPKGSGRFVDFPEIDRVAWVSVAVAREKLLSGQRPLLDQLMAAPELAGYGEGRPDGG
ncbi:NUDIX domain-containing protein [Mycobacterium sp. CBMA247]|nr:NUDIX domain-containing protein [Mycolicibacterium sp. CBMA 329]MUL88816.1 NUDIX domain-containing protein [Mycolicibacterium sp. CBMA 331]MUM01910.1 NUDIX domain-containing protein [Mycolicibacterium sp. CBMA 334]MUM24906.1 NUDIX domain-containing protein [Mycolicibacterium sp. CBMA 295]MUM40463.1 NUDIX domain-containing protein [Mycolicibacterium sp. CBMA 247]MUM44880.1 NUDIX domain-containing protein [Mycolicibacterium sp. CBMA 294]